MQDNIKAFIYSSVVNIIIGEGDNPQTIFYPISKPVRKDSKANLQLINLAADSYLASVYSAEGKAVHKINNYLKLLSATSPDHIKIISVIGFELFIEFSAGE